MDKELLTIKDFSRAVGVSPQAIYKHLEGKLKDYVSTVGNKKMIDKSALSLFEVENCNEKVDKNLNQIENQLIELLKKELEQKNEQIKEKDKQIADLLLALNQAQQLQAMGQQRILELEDKSKVVDVAETEEPEKKHWWTFWR